MRKSLLFLLFLGLGSQGFSAGQPVNSTGTRLTPVQQQQQVQKKINLYDKKKRRHGQWEFYWDDSTKLANKGEFRHGEQIGTWTYYNEDGSLQKIETKKALSKRYWTKMYYPDGKVEREGYARVKKTKGYISYYWYGNWKCYDEQGKLVKIEKYKEGEVEKTVAVTSGSK